MIKVISYFFNTIIRKLLLGQSLIINGFQAFSNSTRLKAEDGGIIEIKKVTTKRNVHISAVHGKIIIGKGVFFNRNCTVISREKITIGDDCIFGPNVVIYDHDHVFNSHKIEKNKYKTKKIIIENGCWIGANVIILKGSTIGEKSVIGAGAIIKGNIPKHSILTVHQDQHIKVIK